MPGRISTPEPRMQDLLHRMSTAGQLTGVPATEEEVARAERAVGVPFPPDYRLFLRASGGASRERQWRMLFRVEELVSLNRTIPLFRWFRGVIGIGNEGFMVTALDYRDGLPPSVVSLGLSSSDEDDITREAGSFTDWLESTLP